MYTDFLGCPISCRKALASAPCVLPTHLSVYVEGLDVRDDAVVVCIDRVLATCKHKLSLLLTGLDLRGLRVGRPQPALPCAHSMRVGGYISHSALGLVWRVISQPCCESVYLTTCACEPSLCALPYSRFVWYAHLVVLHIRDTCVRHRQYGACLRSDRHGDKGHATQRSKHAAATQDTHNKPESTGGACACLRRYPGRGVFDDDSAGLNRSVQTNGNVARSAVHGPAVADVAVR
jgi:hypothetical protein